MKAIILLTLMVSVWKGCHADLKDTTWELSHLSVNALSDNPIEALAIDMLVNNQIEGIVIMVRDDKFIITGDETKVRGINTEGIIMEISSNDMIVEDETGQKHKIQYKLSTDRKTCDFILPNGSVLHTTRMQ